MAAAVELDARRVVEAAENFVRRKVVSFSPNDANFLFGYLRMQSEDDPSKNILLGGLVDKFEKGTKRGKAKNRVGVGIDRAEEEYVAGLLSIEGRDLSNSQKTRVFCQSLKDRFQTAYNQGAVEPISLKERLAQKARKEIKKVQDKILKPSSWEPWR